ncbi:MAG: hypothetical protein QMD65_01935 [Patescibacteria group bacterium]|nr:hypothetical protein [Patescibacteria group bacterium]
MNKQIEKCRICGEPFWDYKEIIEEISIRGICPDCVRKADIKEQNEQRIKF